MSGAYKSFLMAVMMVLLLVSAGCAELPPDGELSWPGAASPPPAGAPEGEDPDPGYLTPVTPYPTATSDIPRSTLSGPRQPTPTPDTYVTIYDRTEAFTQTTKAYSFDLTAPPLIIEFEVEPKMITRIKHAKSDYGSRGYKDYKQTYPSEDAWFEVTVRDRASGAVVAQEGFGRLYGGDTHNKVFVGRLGEYQIQLAGNDVKVHVLMRAGGV